MALRVRERMQRACSLRSTTCWLFLLLFEIQHGPVDAVALAFRAGAVVEDVAHVRAAVGAMDLRARRADLVVDLRLHRRGVDGPGERRPAAARVVLRLRAPQRLAAGDAAVEALALLVEPAAGEG